MKMKQIDTPSIKTDYLGKNVKITPVDNKGGKEIYKITKGRDLYAEFILENQPISVAIYCRISSNKPEQLTSIPHQIQGMIDKVLKNPKYRLYGVYVDIGSGKSVEHRRNMITLLEDCKNKKVQRILTKSVSRFARNLVDTLKILRELKKLGVSVWFEAEKIDTGKENSEFVISVISSLMESKSENKNANIKWGIQQTLRNGGGKMLNRKCYEYKYDNKGNLVIDEDEAKIVRKVFDLYISGYSILKIVKYLKENKIKTSKGKTEWSKRAIETMLSNEKYIGDIRLYKTYGIPYPNCKRRINHGEHSQFYVNDHHPALLPKSVFEKAQKERGSRSNIEIDEYGAPKRKKKRYKSIK